MAIASNEAPDWIRERSATASLSVGTAIRLSPRRAGCERTGAAVARQDARRMSGESFHLMTNDIYGKAGLYYSSRSRIVQDGISDRSSIPIRWDPQLRKGRHVGKNCTFRST